MTQCVFVKVNIFVRNAFAQFFFNCIAYGGTRSRADSTEQSRANHSKREQWSNARHDETRDRQTGRSAARSSHGSTYSRAHCATHTRIFSVGDRYTRFESFRRTAGPNDSDPFVRYTKTS